MVLIENVLNFPLARDRSMSQEDYNTESCDLIINITLFHRNCTCAVWNSQCKLKFESESQKSVINPSPKNNKMLNLFLFIFYLLFFNYVQPDYKN